MFNKAIRNLSTALAAVVFCSCAPSYKTCTIRMCKNDAATLASSANDSAFIAESVLKFGSKGKASRYYSSLGWRYIYSTNIGWSIPLYQPLNNPSKFHEAMQLFDKSWSLDSTNPNAYWGASFVFRERGNNQKLALEMMSKAVKYDSANVRLLFDYGIANIEYLHSTNEISTNASNETRQQAISAFKLVQQLDSTEALKLRSKRYLDSLQPQWQNSSINN